ncbi:hypothetical protein [Larkinella harenae]
MKKLLFLVFLKVTSTSAPKKDRFLITTAYDLQKSRRKAEKPHYHKTKAGKWVGYGIGAYLVIRGILSVTRAPFSGSNSFPLPYKA